jgi:hypothetical protein
MPHTVGFVIERLIPYLGQSEAWWEKHLGFLAAEDRFIGMKRRDMRASDLASALNSRMMGQTKTAVDVDTMLRALVFKGTSAVGGKAAFPGKTWGDVIDGLIKNAPPFTEHSDQPATDKVPPGVLPHLIELTIDVPLITLIWHGPDGRPVRADWYSPAKTYSHSTMIARKTVVNGKIISVLRDILHAPTAILGVADQEPESETAALVPPRAAVETKTRTTARARSGTTSATRFVAAGERKFNLPHGGSDDANPGDTGQNYVRSPTLFFDTRDSH